MALTDKAWQEQTESGVQAFRQGKYCEAEEAFLAAVAMAREAEATPAELGETLNDLAVVYFALSKFVEADKALQEALALSITDPTTGDLQIFRASCLNNRARLCLELEKFAEAESQMLEAIQLVGPVHSVYAAEMYSNLLRLYALVPHWRDNMKLTAEEFNRLHALDEPLEVYFDELAGWRRPGKSWDQVGSASAECIAARSLINKSMYLYDSKHEARSEFEAILQLDEQTKQVPPHILIYAYESLAELAFQSADYKAASELSDQFLRIAAGSYLREHPASYGTFVKAASFSLLSNSSEKTQSLFDSAERLVRNELGECNPHFLKYLVAKSLMLPLFRLNGTDQTSEQLTSLRKCLALSGEFYPANHAWIIEINVFISDICIRSNQLDQAEKTLLPTLINARTGFHANTMECKCLKSLTDLRIKQGRISEAKDYLQQHEALMEEQLFIKSEAKVLALDAIGTQYLEAGLLEDAERVYKMEMVLASPLRPHLVQRASKHLAMCLMRAGKASEASELLGKPADRSHAGSGPGSEQINKRNDFVEQSHLAWGLQTSKRFAEAKVVASKLVNEAHLLMPECEESLVIALSILIEQARAANQPDEIMRLIGVLSQYDSSVRVRCILPTLYLEAAQAFARQRSIKAEPLFEKAMHSAEALQTLSPQVVDACCFAYMNHCMSTRNNEKALHLCERLLQVRTANGGTASKQYSAALTSKAMLLMDSDPSGADAASLQALDIMNALEDGDKVHSDKTHSELVHGDKVQLFLALTVRSDVLKKLLRFDESKELESRINLLKAEIDKKREEAKAKAEL